MPKDTSQITSATKCGLCTPPKCCAYFTARIDTPRSKHDFDHLLWQISHERTQIYKDEDGWFLLINNECRHLQSDGRCAIYTDRPLVCRDYSNDFCEYDESAAAGFELFFTDYRSLLGYCRKRFKRWDKG